MNAHSTKTLLINASLLLGMLLAAASTNAGTLTPGIIWGGGNQNQGFTVEQTGSLELGLRAKRRYPRNDDIGTGIVQDSAGNYLFDSSESTAPDDRAMWSFDWGINSDVNGLGDGLDTYSYLITFDTDPTANTDFTIAYDPLSAISTGYYLGTNASGNGGAAFTSAGDVADGNGGDLSAFNVAQNSVNYGFLGTGVPLGSGQFTVSLLAFTAGTQSLVSSVSINAIVDAPAPVPLPAAAWLFLSGLGGLGLVKRRRQRLS